MTTALRDLVQRMAARLQDAGVAFGHGTDNAVDEAAWLVLWKLGLPLDTDLDSDLVSPQAGGQTALTPAQLAGVEALVDERITTRRPAAYLTGEAWLQGVSFFIDERAIVPRSLIAEPLADGTLDAWLSSKTRHVLDLCTGNGSLAVLAALAWPDVTVHAADLSADALAVAQHNVQRHGLQDRITLFQGDGLAAVADSGTRYDLILCNPPYVNQAAMDSLPAEFRAEPALALAGGSDGMDFIRPLLRAVRACMTNRADSAVLVLEVGNERGHFEAAFPDLPAVWLPTSAGDDQVCLIESQHL